VFVNVNNEKNLMLHAYRENCDGLLRHLVNSP